MAVFSFSTFNKSVRDGLKENVDHPLISERWAKPCDFEVEADSIKTATEKVESQYPSSLGFVNTFNSS